MSNWRTACALCIGVSVITPAAAQAQGVTRQLMQTTDFPDGHTTVTGVATLTAGSCAGAHTHPGLETSYVLEGEIVLKVDGRPDQKFKAGRPRRYSSSTLSRGANRLPHRHRR